FQSLARKATATASPVKISGVARVSVSTSAKGEPAAPLTTRPNTENGDAPAASTSSDDSRTVAATAPSGNSSVTAIVGAGLASSRMDVAPQRPLEPTSRSALFSPFTGRRWRQPDEGQRKP